MLIIASTQQGAPGHVAAKDINVAAVLLPSCCAVNGTLTGAARARQVDAIFRHESQKDRALFLGADPREFWQRARDRNRVRAFPPCPLSGMFVGRATATRGALPVHPCVMAACGECARNRARAFPACRPLCHGSLWGVLPVCPDSSETHVSAVSNRSSSLAFCGRIVACPFVLTGWFVYVQLSNLCSKRSLRELCWAGHRRAVQQAGAARV